MPIDQRHGQFETQPGENRDDVRPTVSGSHSARGAIYGAAWLETEEERLRKRQCVLAFVLGLVFPGFVVWWKIQGEAESGHFLWALFSLAVSGWAAYRFFKKVYGLEKADGQIAVYRQSQRSTEDAVHRVVLEDGSLSALELVWFPLKYPNATRLEFHVRGQDHPWLVLFASGNEARAGAMMKQLASRLSLGFQDRTHEKPADDIPQKYLLTPDEKKATPLGMQLFFAALFAAGGAGFYVAGYVPAAVIFFGLAALIPAGLMWKRAPRKIPHKYQAWI